MNKLILIKKFYNISLSRTISTSHSLPLPLKFVVLHIRVA